MSIEAKRLKNMKLNTEQQIVKVLNQFVETTGLPISDLNFHEDQMTFAGGKIDQIISIELEVKL